MNKKINKNQLKLCYLFTNFSIVSASIKSASFNMKQEHKCLLFDYDLLIKKIVFTRLYLKQFFCPPSEFKNDVILGGSKGNKAFWHPYLVLYHA